MIFRAIPYLVAAAVGFVPAAATSLRPDPGAEPNLIVPTRDLDLTTVEGRASLDRRISRAAHQICDRHLDDRSPRMEAARADCVAATIQESRPFRARAIAAHRARGSATAAVVQD
ncbi:MAG: UrcA family protein [Sphingomonadaceae bacterium]